jgi:hypothetical protein
VRSRPDLTLYLRPPRPTPGSRFEAQAVLRSRSETPIDGVEVHLVGFEERHAQGYPANAPAPTWGRGRHVDLVARAPKRVLTPGEHRFTFAFDLPPSAPPAYESRTARVVYDLQVRVEIPWWPDRTGRFLVPVEAVPTAPAGAPPLFCTDARGPQGTGLYLEASLDAAAIPLGGVLRGAVSLANVAHHRVRRIDLALVQMECGLGETTGIEGHRYELSLYDGAPEEGKAIPFKVRLPEDASVSFRGAVFQVRWYLEIRAVVTLGSDVKLVVPFRIHRSDAAPRRDGAPAVRVPPIGRERRALLWAESARRNGLDNDAENERMTLALAGSVALAITLEPRKSGGLALTAALSWPDLGIGVALSERRWVDAWASGACSIDVPGFAERFTARGREGLQVRALLDTDVCEWLIGFDEAAMGDEGATLVSATPAQTLDELNAFVERAVGTARSLAEGLRRVPAPLAMEGFVPAWRAFSASVQGRFSIGDMSVREATFDGLPLDLVTEWHDDGHFDRTAVRIGLPQRDGASAIDPGAVDLSRAALEKLEPKVTLVGVDDTSLEAVLGMVSDPATLEPTLAALVRAARQLTGSVSRGPYR